MSASTSVELAADVAEPELEEIESVAVELANLAAAEIVMQLGGMFSVRYKTGKVADEKTLKDPVSEVDHRVETLIRARLAEKFPQHDIIGEEMDERPGRDQDYVWAVDPIDGTANFVNGFPLFAASIGVLFRGRPVVGAVWCAASHKLRAGVYHAHQGGGLCFDGQPLALKPNPAVRRRLAGVPDAASNHGGWETRKTGSAAIECAMTAAGLLRVARFEQPNIWDVAGGIALVKASGGVVMQHTSAGWRPLDRLEPSAGTAGGKPDLRNWRRALVMGERESVDKMCDLTAS